MIRNHRDTSSRDGKRGRDCDVQAVQVELTHYSELTTRLTTKWGGDAETYYLQCSTIVLLILQASILGKD